MKMHHTIYTCIYIHSLTFLNIRRIAELEEKKCKLAIQDIMYLLIIFKFYAFDVSLVPKISKCLRNGKLELPDMERKLKYIQSWELWDTILEILNLITFAADSFGMKLITKDLFAKMYVASILYGYFLKSVSSRYELEKRQSLSDRDLNTGHGSKDVFLGKQEIENGTLKDYVKGFKRPKLVLDGCKLRYREALQLVESHTQALFEHIKECGLNEFDDDEEEDDRFIEASFSSIKRLLWEGLAFGSFLWMAEDFIDGICKLEEREVK